ncbi:hypothetical protein KBD45_05480 [Candidatus Dojkabacteria bacterium]|nr:hypothetical protein [Candidatus Dojkabacteria bacterium]
MPRNLLKTILLILAKFAIRKHGIKFIIICGWHRTTIVKEEMYNYLSEDYNVRRNIQNIWWDLSLPLDILGYKDRRYSTKGWFKMIIKTIGALLTGPKNPHKIIIDLNFSDKNTSKYWKKIIKPELLIILNYKQSEKELFEVLIQSTIKNKGKVFVSNTLGKKFMKYEKFGSDKEFIITPKHKFKYNHNLPKVFVETYPSILSTLENYGWNEDRIKKTISTHNFTEELISKITRNIFRDNTND